MRAYAVSATVTNGSPNVTCAGAALLANAYEGDSLLLPNGTSWPIKSVNGNTSLTLEGNFVGTGGTYAAFITRRNDAWVSSAQVNLKYSQALEALLRGYTLMSPTSLAIGAGSKAFTTQGDAPILPGARVRASSNANPSTHWMEGVVTAYAGGVMTLSVDVFAGSDSRADWSLNLAGARGAMGGVWGSSDTPQMAGIELGHATDTTLTRAAAGQIQVEGSRVFQRNNILGAVSQASGVPTGAVIEAGSNANGDYVKFADGTMICRRSTWVNVSALVAAGSVWRDYTSSGAWTFPAAFAAVPQAYVLTVSTIYWVSIQGPLNASGAGGAVVFSYVNAPSTIPVSWLAIGRWY